MKRKDRMKLSLPPKLVEKLVWVPVTLQIKFYHDHNFRKTQKCKPMEKGIIRIGKTVEIVGLRGSHSTIVTSVKMFQKTLEESNRDVLLNQN